MTNIGKVMFSALVMMELFTLIVTPMVTRSGRSIYLSILNQQIVVLSGDRVLNNPRIVIIGHAPIGRLIAEKLSGIAKVEVAESEREILVENGFDEHLFDNMPMVEQPSPYIRRVRKSKGERKRNKNDRWG